MTKAKILERGFHRSVSSRLPELTLFYSDRGSARAKRIGGGGGQPAPRIDYPDLNDWYFFRFDEVGGYKKAADALKAVKGLWNSAMRIWGTQMIERTALNDPYAITSPARATAVRINLHMHRQIFYANPGDAIKLTDDEWVD